MGKTAAILAALVVFLSALPAAAGFVGTDDAQVMAVAEPILDNLLAGFNQGNYAQYSRDFDDTLREAISEKKFNQVREDIIKKMGTCKDKKYLGFLNQQANTVVLWKAACTGASNDILIKLVLSRRQDKVVVTGLWFQ